LDTPKKFSPVPSPLITDKLSQLELIKELNFGILLLIANLPVKFKITLNGYHVLDIHLFLKPKAKLLLIHILLQLVGMED